MGARCTRSQPTRRCSTCASCWRPAATPGRSGNEPMSRVRIPEPEFASVVWHDLECHAYTADLALWRVVAGRAARRGKPCDVLDLGCGTGRVALDLGAHGHRVTGLELDATLADELRRRAAAQNVAAGAVVAD